MGPFCEALGSRPHAGKVELRRTDHCSERRFQSRWSQHPAAGADRTVRVWDVESGRLKATLRGHTSQIQCVTFSPNDRTLTSSSNDGTVRLWDISSNRLRTIYSGHAYWPGHEGRVWSVAFSPDGRTLASCGRDSRVNLWDLSKSQGRIQIPIPGRAVRSMIFSPDSRHATVFALDGTDGLIVCVDLSRGELIDRRRLHLQNPIVNGSLGSDGKAIATVTLDEVVTLWAPRARRPSNQHSCSREHVCPGGNSWNRIRRDRILSQHQFSCDRETGGRGGASLGHGK